MSKSQANKGVVYVVLLYPPHGKPRVCEIAAPGAFVPPIQMFKIRAKAEAALEKFLTENPEYREWDGGLIKKAEATP